MSTILGVDLGLDGAIAVLRDRKIVAMYDLPTVEVQVGKRMRREHVPAGAVVLVRELCDDHKPDVAVLERLHAMPTQRHAGETDKAFEGRLSSGASANFSRGAALYTYLTAFAACDVQVERISPGKWKRDYGLTADKTVSLAKAIELFPHAYQWLRRAKDHNRGEAILLAEWLRRKRELDAARMDPPTKLRAVS